MMKWNNGCTIYTVCTVYRCVICNCCRCWKSLKMLEKCMNLNLEKVQEPWSTAVFLSLPSSHVFYSVALLSTTTCEEIWGWHHTCFSSALSWQFKKQVTHFLMSWSISHFYKLTVGLPPHILVSMLMSVYLFVWHVNINCCMNYFGSSDGLLRAVWL